MADFYAQAFVGVKDGTVVPAGRANGALVGSKKRTILGVKPTGTALAAADRLFIGTIRANERVSAIRVITDTSLGTSTIAIGSTAAPAKYVAARTYTTPLDTPTPIGPKASVIAAGVETADTDVWVTVAVATIAGGTVLAFEIDICSQA